MTKFNVGDSVCTRKPHACGNNKWTVLRVGADYKIQCEKCGHVVMLSSEKFRKAVKDAN
ncbi:MAG: DUF951 domain-containing protein [Clostridia bacterium]|nr:DUF951 domain-containing protein [Clostridia bacterium]MBQ3067277.1 DUF951 domain-containing protein [Clostridia bacterium]MBR2965982.1 DUF951 domain-containing protein [Clostridia bacterium]